MLVRFTFLLVESLKKNKKDFAYLLQILPPVNKHLADCIIIYLSINQLLIFSFNVPVFFFSIRSYCCV